MPRDAAGISQETISRKVRKLYTVRNLAAYYYLLESDQRPEYMLS